MLMIAILIVVQIGKLSFLFQQCLSGGFEQYHICRWVLGGGSTQSQGSPFGNRSCLLNEGKIVARQDTDKGWGEGQDGGIYQ